MTGGKKKKSEFNPESKDVQAYLRQLNSSLLIRLYFLKNLPSALYWGIGVEECTPYKSRISLPYNLRTKNPFRSIYFAAQCGAAELSTGLLATIAIRGRGPISMLIIDMHAEFIKKATSTTIFTCQEGEKLLQGVQKALESGEGQVVTLETEGVQENGQVVSRMRFTWSFKKKSH